MCPGDNVTITCTGSGVGVAWRTSLVGGIAVLLNVSDTTILDTFTLTLTSKTNGIITSTATADDIQFNTFDIECSLDGGANYVLAQITVAGINSRWHTLHSNYNIFNRLYSIKLTYSSSSDGSR